MIYKIVSDEDFGVKKCYFYGWNKKYSDMFDVVPESEAKKFTNKEEAQKIVQRLNRVGYNFYIEETSKKEQEILDLTYFLLKHNVTWDTRKLAENLINEGYTKATRSRKCLIR